MNNGLFLSPYSHGTSFSDIVESIKLSTKKHSWKIIFIGGEKSATPSNIKDNFFDAEGDILAYHRDLGKLFTNSDKFKNILFIDFFTPGIDILQYLLEIKGKNIKLGALLHDFVIHDEHLLGSEMNEIFGQRINMVRIVLGIHNFLKIHGYE